MNDAPTTVLLVEANLSDARLIEESLAGMKDSSFRIEKVTRLSEALERLGRADIEVVLLDLALPDSQGVEAFAGVRGCAECPDPAPEQSDR